MSMALPMSMTLKRTADVAFDCSCSVMDADVVLLTAFLGVVPLEKTVILVCASCTHFAGMSALLFMHVGECNEDSAPKFRLMDDCTDLLSRYSLQVSELIFPHCYSGIPLTCRDPVFLVLSECF